MSLEPGTKRRLSTKIWIGVGVTLAVLGICLGVVLIWEVSWLLLGGFGLLGFVVWVAIISIILWQKWTRKEPETLKVNLEDAEELSIYKMKYDTENPDNFVIRERRLWKIGQQGAERVPILALIGKGSELMEDRIVLINQKNTNERTVLINATIEEAHQEAINMAENQPDIVTREFIPGGVDNFGMPTPGRYIEKSVSRAEAKKKEEEEKALEKATF